MSMVEVLFCAVEKILVVTTVSDWEREIDYKLTPTVFRGVITVDVSDMTVSEMNGLVHFNQEKRSEAKSGCTLSLEDTPLCVLGDSEARLLMHRLESYEEASKEDNKVTKQSIVLFYTHSLCYFFVEPPFCYFISHFLQVEVSSR